MKVAMLDVETFHGLFGKDMEFAGSRGNQLELIAEAAAHKPDILLAPEYFLHAQGKAPYTREEKDALLRQIADIAGRDNNLIIPGTIIWQEQGLLYNTSPVIIGGKKVKEHNKSIDTDIIQIAAEFGLIVSLGTEQGDVIDWNDKQVGLEICVEHKLGLLKKSERKTDLHIVVGCNGDLKGEYNTARRGLFGIRKGYMLLCDGVVESRANKGSGNFIDDIAPQKYGNVRIYELEL